ncbi:multiple epidermal growth factor-like domains protein 10 isoform X2 [Saccostrea cucullata]|uniref:multiple epidermal growth factor-like domains protein 10 isoform X2 n=1 Tax=Saccostrea cuccullata TaxID=36930 RepID=UPI002ED0B66C
MRRWNVSSFMFVFCLPYITSSLVSQCLFGEIYDMATNSCVVCAEGYSGPNCSIRCPFPGYGKACQLTCSCAEEECDATTGCIYSTMGRKTETETKIYEITDHIGVDVLSTLHPSQLNSFQSTDLLTNGNQENEHKNISREIGIGVLSSVLVILAILFGVFIFSKRKYCQKSHEEGYETHYEDINEL